uniref:Leucine rich immune protein (Coil-less) n=1 Tax=Anopheles maculatus TaxID=74869 RepID=A0A182SFN3_9DIPT
MTIIKRCQLFNRIPVQKILVAVSQLFNQTTLQQYYEQDFTIPNRMASESIELLSAPFLMRLAIHPNQNLRSLFIVNSAVQRIPETITNLRNLRFLGIDKSNIRILDLRLLCDLPKLRTLQLHRNQISLLLPASKPSCVNSLRELLLNYNLLTTLDLALFAPFVHLERMFIEHNLMHSIVCSNQTSFPRLTLLVLGP